MRFERSNVRDRALGESCDGGGGNRVGLQVFAFLLGIDLKGADTDMGGGASQDEDGDVKMESSRSSPPAKEPEAAQKQAMEEDEEVSQSALTNEFHHAVEGPL